MSVGTAFHPRTAPLNRKMQWREWSGYYASSAYADFHDIEYNAIREAAALIDVSPLYKYVIGGPDALRLVDRVITRDATRLTPGGVLYTPWCDEHGKVVDDGTIHHLDDGRFRWTAADPQLRWLRQNGAGLDVTITEETESTAAVSSVTSSIVTSSPALFIRSQRSWGSAAVQRNVPSSRPWIVPSSMTLPCSSHHGV